MSYVDFCWMWFMCLNDSEFIDLIVYGALSAIRQAYSTLSERKERYLPTLTLMVTGIGADEISMSKITIVEITTDDTFKNVTRHLHNHMNTRLDTYIGTISHILSRKDVYKDINCNSLLGVLKRVTVLKTGCTARGWNASMKENL
jgi:hypothetical protein